MKYDINYDNFMNSMTSLFILSTLEGWPDYMYQAIDASDNGPIMDNNQPLVNILFICFIFIGSIFCVNLFVAIVSLNFHLAQQKNENKTLTKDQV